MLAHGNLSIEQIEKINTAKFISTLDRLLSTPTVRAAMGFDIDKGKLFTQLPADEAIKPLRRIVLDLANKDINVNDVKSKEQQNAYISKLKSSDRPDLAKRTGHAVAIDSIKEKDFSAKNSLTKQVRAPHTKPRTSVIPNSCRLKINTPKINGI